MRRLPSMGLRVAFLLQDQPAIYGAERACLDLLQGLLRETSIVPEVWLIEERRLGPGAFGRALDATGVPVQRIPVEGAFSRSLLRVLAAKSREVEVIHAVGPKADLHLALARCKARKVSTMHGWLFRKEGKERLHEWLDAWSLKRMDRVVALSSFYEELLARKGIRVQRIPTGFDLETVAGIRREPGPGNRVGVLGRLSSEKNHGLLLEAMARLPDLELWIAGDGPEEGRLRARADSLGLADRVRFLGFVPREEVFASIDVLVLCSLVENLPYTLMEAMALRIPVVASRAGGMPDLVEDGRTGWLVPPGDPEALAGALREAVGQPEDRIEASFQKLKSEFSLLNSTRAHERLYHECCDA